MSKDLPPQFYDENGSEICPSCFNTDACAFAGFVRVIHEVSDANSRASQSDAFAAEAAVDSPKVALERRIRVSETTEGIDTLLGGACLRFARVNAGRPADS